MKNTKRIIALIIVIVTVFAVAGCGAKTEKASLTLWNECDALTSLKAYVADVTDEKSENFIPKQDRIAVFDMDGTLYGELFPTYIEYLLCAYRCLDDPTYTASAEMKEVATAIREGAKVGKFPSDMPMQHALCQAKAFEGMSIDEFEKYVKDFLKMTPEGFEGMTYAEAFYKPMIEVISFLQDNGFLAYIVSGSDRFICRALASEACGIPYERVIGMDVKLVASNQGEKDSLDYQFTSGDRVLRTSTLLIKNLKMNKVAQIAQEIGRQPVLSFGNSSGDVSMHMYTITNNKYKSAAFMLIADDEDRDWGNTEKTTKLGEDWKNYGFIVISMKNDFKTIYGDKVKKTSR